MADVFAEGIEETVRKAVDAVSALKKNEVCRSVLAAKLGARQERRQSPAPGRNRPGYLVNLETRIGRPARIGLGVEDVDAR